MRSRSQREAMSKAKRTMLCAGMEGITTLNWVSLRTKAGDGAVPDPDGQAAAPFGLGPDTGWQVALVSKGWSASGWSIVSMTPVAVIGPLLEIVATKCSVSSTM